MAQPTANSLPGFLKRRIKGQGLNGRIGKGIDIPCRKNLFNTGIKLGIEQASLAAPGRLMGFQGEAPTILQHGHRIEKLGMAIGSWAIGVLDPIYIGVKTAPFP